MKWPEDFIGKVINGDCIEVMKQMPDKCVDLVITDPPYGMDYQSNWSKDGPRHERIANDDHYPVEILPELKRIARAGVLLFCRWDNLYELPKPKSFIVWDKGVHSMGDLKGEYGRRWEGIAFYPQEEHGFNKRGVDVIFCPRVNPESLVHPNEKPVQLIELLIQNLQGDIVFDPFAGSGTTLEAADRANRNWCGVELSEKFCGIARKRISKEQSQGRLF